MVLRLERWCCRSATARDSKIGDVAVPPRDLTLQLATPVTAAVSYLPSTGAAPVDSRAHTASIPLVVRDGVLLVELKP